MKLMRWSLLGVLVASACSSPLTPTPIVVPVVTLTPAAIALEVSPATRLGEHLLTLYVRDASGLAVPAASVSLSTTAGTLSQATVQSGPTGQAQARLVTTENATVTARIGDVVTIAHADAYTEPEMPPPSVFIPPPPVVAPPPVVTPPPPAPTLAATLSCTPVTHGSPTPCNVTATYGGVPLASAAVTNVDWDWGDGVATSTAVPVSTRTYVNAGSYTVLAVVTATTVDGAKTATGTKTITVP